ncbi:hypothetical protein FNV43_RR01478 [Rhamnella rubrinervis]|uniref:Uncharacterized protein n=1 Tax=Rhamnella rubrinervis TaxID=2594499 RepID=A0A8K0HSL3_9ROSA|nr:hypothetical protein FNV43_RR01478 [Rhamnella rubrinervis]
MAIGPIHLASPTSLALPFPFRLISPFCLLSALNGLHVAHRHNAKHMLNAALSLITDNMDKLTKRDEYMEVVEKDPRFVVEIYEAYLSKQVNTATHKDS